MKECCGNCRNHKFDTEYQEYYCTEPDSENCGEFTDCTDSCDEFFERASL